MKSTNTIAVLSVGILSAFTLLSCETVTGVAAAGGLVTQEQADSLAGTAEAVQKSFEDITPEQEYYIGRSVGAVILNQYDTYDDPAANEYLNILGQSIALASDRPELFGGYRFQILESGEINAFATPSGLIFLTRGMLRLAQSEDDVAAIIAHEVGHIVEQHGLKAIKTSRINTALTSAALTSAQFASNEDVAELTAAFEDSVQDVTSTLVNSGYSRGAEREADAQAVAILRRLGYDPRSLIRVLEAMDRELEPGGLDFAKTHPDPEDRIEDIEKELDLGGFASAPPAVRQARFETALGRI
ncbi:MAG: M48 family metalloprotease [Spirochaetaceae bacterium]